MERRIGSTRLATLVGEPGENGPAYVWLADRVSRLVTDGQLLHDTRLPGERETATALGLSRTTVTHAYALLRERGLVEARRGSGTRITVPGGQVAGGGEPLAGGRGWHDGRPVGPEDLDLTNAAPPALDGLGAVYEASVGLLGSYTHSGGYHQAGIPALREAIADRYTARGAPTSPDQILVTTGALSGVAASAHALLGRGDRVVADACGYPNSLAALRGLGARLIPAPERNGRLDLPTLGEVLRRSAPKAMLTMPDFHNPTGRSVGEETRAQVAALWKRHDVLGIVDETLADLWWDEPPTARPMAAHAPGCVSVGSASKTYWGGLRLGWVRAPRSLIGAVAAARLTLDLGAPVLEQIVLARLLRERPGLDDDRRAQLGRRRHILRDAILQACPGWECEVPAGGLSLWWHLPRAMSSEIVALAGARGLALTPGSAFALDGHGLEGWLRTPFTLPEEDLRQAAVILGGVTAELTA